jgi:hypothetical protein
MTTLELERSYTPTPEEMAWLRGKVRTPGHRLSLALPYAENPIANFYTYLGWGPLFDGTFVA